MRPSLLRRRPRHPTREAQLLLIVGALVATAPRAALADPGDSCVSAYEEAQSARKSNELVRSKANLRLCEKACPAALSSDCAAWSRELDALVPTVVIEVAGVDGASISDAKVFIDDVEQDAATPIELDPGAHRVRVSAPGFADAADALELAPGAHVTRSIRLVPTTREQPSLLGPALVMGGGGLLLLVAGALSIAGHVDVSKMRSTCAPTCDPERVDAVEMMWIAGGIAGGTGGLMALLGGVWLGVKLSAGVSSESASAALTVQF